MTQFPDTKASAASPHPSRRSLAGLDWFTFFLADVQTGFGPFVSVYLTTAQWTQQDIGFILSVTGIVGLIGRMPGGAIVDAARSERKVAAIAVVCIGISALILAAWPLFAPVFLSTVLSASANCVLAPAIGAISLGLVGHFAIGPRLGRNARFASLGTVIAAGAMGIGGHFFSSRSVFIITALLLGPTLIALWQVRPAEIDPARAHGGTKAAARPEKNILRLALNMPLLVFAACNALFQLANAAMLPLMGSILTMRSANWATVLIAACIIVPQLIVAALSPWVGRRADKWGRRPLLLIGFGALPVRCLLFAYLPDPTFVVFEQILDGVSAAVLGVLVPLVIADISRDTGRFNLAQGIVGTAVGIGAALSTSMAGYVSDHSGNQTAFLDLAAIAACGFAFVLFVMPETRPRDGVTSVRRTKDAASPH